MFRIFLMLLMRSMFLMDKSSPSISYASYVSFAYRVSYVIYIVFHMFHPAETRRDQHKTNTKQRIWQRPAETNTKPPQNSETGRDQEREQHKTSTKNSETGRDQQRPAQNQHKEAKPAGLPTRSTLWRGRRMTGHTSLIFKCSFQGVRLETARSLQVP